MNSEPIFFMHFPRTAGTTIDVIFEANLPAEKIIKIYSHAEYAAYRSIEAESLNDIKYITGHLLLDELNPTKIYGRKVRAFTILRDPVKRLFSEYNFLKTWKGQHLYSFLNQNNISFPEYIRSNEKLLKYRGKNFITRCISGDSLEKTNNIQASLEKAKYNLLNNFWFFGIQERFNESIILLSEKANLQNILHQRHNALVPQATESFVSNEYLEVIYEYNSADIELYNFAAAQFDQHIKSLGNGFKKRLKNFMFMNKKYQKIASLLYDSVNKAVSPNAPIKLPKDTRW